MEPVLSKILEYAFVKQTRAKHMIDITKQAVTEIKKQYGKGTTPVFVRVLARTEGCKVPVLSLHESAPTNSDETFALEGVTIIVDSDLEADLGGVKIRYDASHWGGGHLSVSPLVNLVAGTCGDCRC